MVNTKYNNIFTNIFLFTFSIILGITACEILGRVMGLGDPVLYYADSLIGYRLKPNQKVKRFKNSYITVNNEGFRVASLKNKNSSVKNVVFVGDSVTYGGSYINDNDLFSELFCESSIEDDYCLNGAINSWGLQNMGRFISNGAASLYYDGSEKIATTSSGVTVTGGITLGDSHFIGDQTNDNLLIQSSNPENIEYNSGNGAHLFHKNGSEMARISDDGHLLIGRTSLLTDFGDGRTSLVLQGTGSQDYATIQIGNNGTASNTQILGFLSFYDGTSQNARVQAQRHTATDSANLQFFTRANGGALTEKMQINSAGQVGIGTTSPIATLHTASGSSGRSWSSGVDRVIHEANSTNIMQIVSSTTGTAGINFADTDARAVSGVEYDHNAKNMHISVNEGAGTIKFFNTSERMRIDNAGNVGILNTSPSSYGNATELVVGNHSIDDAGITIATTTGSSGRFQFSDNTASPFVGAIEYAHSNNFMYFYTSGSQRLKITNLGYIQSPPTAGNTTGSGANMHVTVGGEFAKSTSSKRYKNTINDATHGLAELLKLRSVTYKGNNDGDIIFGGLIAEEVHDVGLTEFVQYDDEDKPESLHYTHMIALCVKAIQELEARITALESS